MLTRLKFFYVALSQMEYQLPRLTKIWTHLERQAGGQVKGMGEKQIEVDKRILRTQVSSFFLLPVILYIIFLSKSSYNLHYLK